MSAARPTKANTTQAVSTMTPRQFAAAFGYTEGQLKQWRRRGIGPPWFRISPRRIRYHVGDVERWQSQRAVRSDESRPRARSL